MEIIITTRQRM